ASSIILAIGVVWVRVAFDFDVYVGPVWKRPRARPTQARPTRAWPVWPVWPVWQPAWRSLLG
ncbi:hypothetical protein, partial [Kribbella sp. NPDC003557]|uniref:hypothetical protein n=1 Tax=Kribbella sp. NPDC003557 TaxID=3154449 RepID=UPI0033B8BE07